MTRIEQIKRQGEIDALKRTIDGNIFELSHVFSSYKDNKHFTRLGECIAECEAILSDTRMVLTALQQVEPKNK